VQSPDKAADATTLFPWTRALARILVPKSRYSRIFLAITLFVVSLAWCLWYQPWRAHYHGRKSDYWARVLVAQHWNRTASKRSPFALWMDSFFDRFGRETTSFEDPDFVPVLEELIDDPDPEVCLASALYLHQHGDKGFRRALPRLVEALLADSSLHDRCEICRILGARARHDSRTVRAAIPDAAIPALTEILGDLRDESIFGSDDVARVLGAIGPRHAQWVEDRRWWKISYVQFPARWSVAQTGTGERGSWTPLEESPWRVNGVAQMGSSSASVCNLCVSDYPSVKDVKLHVTLMPTSGNVSRSGGVLWRYQDAANYYATRVDFLEGNFCLYKVVAGKLIPLASREVHRTPPLVTPVQDPWHKLTARHYGNRIECWLDGTIYLEATDETISVAGKVGLWTKADANTQFELLKLTNLQP
jgi:hypothetical protein